ncbi:non-ribosomal peptide synthetase [Dechloromonas denitrificans]|uniref:non-ribosomal peptide synthetase n=1 Tax=Dechloromonas denitrificans TaxID=281362 RepID=UPI001CF97A75|nr:non-ribosomal peptide synthetase [Dechloromonas denitrificans]UCV09877.1 amino acid adenylation domain-containing protein [Dechloromonas denitrificans]
MDRSVASALEPELLPLSLSQQEVWLDQRAWPGSTHLNIGGAGYIDGPFDLALFHQALTQLVAENEALRLVPLLEGGQRLLPAYDAPLLLVDVSTAENPLAAMRVWWQDWMAEPFVFDGNPPWRFALLRHSDTLHGLTIQFHHLIMDGWGTSQVMQRWATLYNVLAGSEARRPTSDPGYRQFVADSLEYRHSPSFAKDAEFWQQQLPVLPPPLFERRYAIESSESLPTAHLITQNLPRADYDHLASFAAGLGVTLFGYLVGVLAAYFARAYGRDEVVIGLPSLNRSGKRYRETFGMFVGVFPLVVKVSPGITVRELLGSVNLALKAAVRRQRYPVSELARHLAAIRHRRDSVFDVLFSYERQDYDLNFGAGRSFGSRQIFSGLARYPLGITLCEFQSVQDAELTLEASPACFSATEVGYLGQRIAHLMQGMAAHPDQCVEDFDLLPPAEFAALTQTPCAAEASPEPYICQFQRQAEITPNASAVVWDGGSLDYATLDAWSGYLAVQLVSLGAGRGGIVALVMERSPEMLAATLAINKVGAAFLPLDPDAPLARLQGIVDESGALAVLVQPAQRERFSALQTKLLTVFPEPASRASLNGLPQPTPGDLAYVLFTSGSTGQPKGVMVEHAALSSRLAWISRAYGVVPSDRTGQCTQATFDPSLIELFLPLINGASVALPPAGRLVPRSLGPFAVRHAVTIMALVPSTLRGLLDSVPDFSALKLRVACCGGEVLPVDLANRFIDQTGARLFNVYGPTEATIFASAWECQKQSADASLPIGRAIDDSRIYILDSRGALLPFGIPGEVYLAGAAIARGYINRPELDREAFFADPFVPGQRMYRTGDRGWLATDGNLHFLGRLDRQIKLRGYRIEQGEIEAALLAVDGVQQAAVKLLERHGKQAIYAWVAGSPQLSASRIRQYLACRLPDYMLPAGISRLPELPVNGTGKIAYDRLPEPEAEVPVASSRLPANDMERALLALWQVVLKRDGFGVTDNFFDVGGDSLAAVDILVGVETLVGRSVPLFILTENPSVEQLALALGQGKGQRLASDVMLHLGRSQGKTPLYFAASGHGDLIRFRNLADVLGEHCDLYMLQPPTGRPVLSISGLARDYAERILAHGRPGVLAGFSVGGIAALETARHLQALGFPVPRLCLVDTVYPGRLLRSAIFWKSLGWLARHMNAHELSMNGRHLGALFSDPGLIAQINAMADYRLDSYSGAVSLIKSSGLVRWERWVFQPWRKQMEQPLDEILIEGLHGSIFERDNIQSLARALLDLPEFNHPEVVKT